NIAAHLEIDDGATLVEPSICSDIIGSKAKAWEIRRVFAVRTRAVRDSGVADEDTPIVGHPAEEGRVFLTKADASGPAAGIADVSKVSARHERRAHGDIAGRAGAATFG